MRLVSMVSLLAICILAGCARKGQQDKGDEAARKTVQENVAGMNTKDVTRVMATLDSKSDGYAKKKGQLEAFFKKYDIAYKLLTVEVERMDGTEAEVRFIQEAVCTSGPADFRDYRAEGRHLLRKDGEQWKIYETVVDYNEYLYK